MPRKKRSFIDKKKAVKFQVVHRSQRDPLAADNDATQYVLQPVLDPAKASRAQAAVLESVPAEVLQALDDGLEFDEESSDEGDGSEFEDFEGEQDDDEEEKGFDGDFAVRPGDAVDEEGVLLPGEYDYSKHLKPIGGRGGKFVPAPHASQAALARAETREVRDESVFFGNIQLEKTLFASDKEERVGLLLRGVVDAPRFNLPNDVKKALDAAEDSDVDDEFDELEDNFVALAMGLEGGEEGGGEEERKEEEEEEESGGQGKEQEERKPALRVEELLDAADDAELEERKLRMLDEHFERLMTEYEDEEIGELDEDDPRVRGTDTLDEHAAALDEYLKRGRAQYYQPNKPEFEDENQDRIKELVVARAKVIEASEGGKPAAVVDREIDDQFQPKEREQWDCESIVSTYSTTSNIPRIIREPRKGVAPQIAISKRTGIPLGVLGVEEGNEEEDEEEEEEERPNLGARRNKGETKEEKAARKRAQKEMKRQRRAQKKATKQLYAAENSAEARRQTSDLAAAQGAVRM